MADDVGMRKEEWMGEEYVRSIGGDGGGGTNCSSGAEGNV